MGHPLPQVLQRRSEEAGRVGRGYAFQFNVGHGFPLNCCTILPDMARVASLFFVFLLFGFHIAFGQATLLTDDQARDVAASAIRGVYPEPCYSTYRDERLEGFLPDLVGNPLVDNQISNSVYFFHLASDVCSYVIMEKDKPVVRTQVSSDCCEYGIVAVNRSTSKSFWFSEPGKNAADIFEEFVQDTKLRPDFPKPILFASLYRELVWGRGDANEIASLRQLQDLVRSNFQSAYSPYERDNAWAPKFQNWWQRFQSRDSHLKLETTYQETDGGTIVRGYAFSGFELTIPRSDLPPKGTPKLFQWAIFIKRDGEVEEQSPKIIYSRR